MNYTPRNTQYNRDLGILESGITLLEKRNGFAYFLLLHGDKKVFAQCSAGVFDSQFQQKNDSAVDAELLVTYSLMKKTAFKQYPKELKTILTKI